MFTHASRTALIRRIRVRLREAAGTGDPKLVKELLPIEP
jgi:hypothetical protein